MTNSEVVRSPELNKTNLLLENEEDVKTVQAMMRHANPTVTLGVYAHAVDRKKRAAQSKVVQMVLPVKEKSREETA